MNITLIHGFNPGPYTGAGNNTYLIGGREPTLIDAGTGEARHLEALRRALVAQSSRLTRVLVTHGHSDHASGSAAIAEHWPEAEFLKASWPERDDRYPVRWHWLHDGGVISAGDTELRAVHTPGHAPDHLCFFHVGNRVLFCGDLAVKGSTVMIPASHGGGLKAYLASLRLVLELRPAKLLPAHGPEIDDPTALIQHYIDHRRRREDRIVAALRNGCRTPESIVARVYEGLASDLKGAASETVLAHLIKLRDEHRARQEVNGEWAKV